MIAGWLISSAACNGVFCVPAVVHIFYCNGSGDLDRPCLPWCLPETTCTCNDLSGRFRRRRCCEYRHWDIIASLLTLCSTQGNNSLASHREQNPRELLPKTSWLTILAVCRGAFPSDANYPGCSSRLLSFMCSCWRCGHQCSAHLPTYTYSKPGHFLPAFVWRRLRLSPPPLWPQ